MSALEADRILGALACFAPEETARIFEAIAHHSAKDTVHGEMAELVKDADVLQHILYNPARKADRPRSERLERVLRELGLA